jgi:hypothetical protein
MFCLVADIEIRRATANRKGLQDALRAIVAEGATIDTEWPLERLLRVGDHATGTNVLTNLYNSWKETPVSVNLDKLWLQLGVQVNSQGIVFDSDAPLADLRSPITEDQIASLCFFVRLIVIDCLRIVNFASSESYVLQPTDSQAHLTESLRRRLASSTKTTGFPVNAHRLHG